MNCPICNSNTKLISKNPNILHCSSCGIYKSEYLSFHKEIDDEAEQNIMTSIETLRRKNYQTILKKIKNLSLSLTQQPNTKSTLKISGLDIGSARGWFLEEAQKQGIEMDGIEPNEKFYKSSKAKGFNVYKGLFPQDFTLQKKYDFIIFNDVLEHIPDLKPVLKSCNSLLKPNGILVINCPNSKGLLFNVAQTLQRFGIKESWKRMWQVDFYSPHIWYFNKINLTALLSSYNFKPLTNVKLKTVTADGLKERIMCSCKTSQEKILGFTKFLIIFISMPVLNTMSNDILCQFYCKKEENLAT